MDIFDSKKYFEHTERQFTRETVASDISVMLCANIFDV